MKNAFERRRDHRKLLRTAKTKEAQLVKIPEIEKRMRAYEEAYKECYDTRCKVSYKAGWYWVHSRRVRAEKLEEMTTRLQATLHERELNLPEEV
jgi:hypothetical protein